MRRRRASARRSPDRALLIDGLGTLVALVPPAPLLCRELERRYAVAVSEAEARRALGAEIAFYRAHMGQGRDAQALDALRRRCAEVLWAALPADERLAAAGGQERVDTLLAALRFEPFPDARPALSRARRAGARIVVVSNWDVSLLEVLERTGLAALLDGAVTSAAVGVAKPGAAIFDQALALAGVGPGAALHVGDNLAEDVAGAAALGIRAVLLRRPGTQYPPTPAAAGGEPGAVPVIAGLDALDWPAAT